MKWNSKRGAALALTMATVASASLFSTQARASDLIQDGKFKFATEVGYEPFTYMDADGKLVGADVELAGAVAETIGAEPEIVSIPFDTLLPGLAAKRFTVVWANLTPTAERLKSVDFVTYAQAGLVVMAVPGKSKDLAADQGLCGKRVGTPAGGVTAPLISQWNDECEKAGKAELTDSTFAGASEQRLAALADRVDFILDDSTAGETYQAKSGGKLVVVKGPLNVQPLAIAVAKGNAAGAEVLRGAIQKLIDNGKYKEIMDKYNLQTAIIDKAQIIDSEDDLAKK